jgi:hypothetical protein
VRTHVLRTTWHDVRPADLRWLLALTAPRVRQQLAGTRRELGLDDEVLATARRAVEPAVTGRALTRPQVAQVLADAGLALDARALGYVLMLLELDAVVCSGVRAGHLHSYALLDERVPPSPTPGRPDDRARAPLPARPRTGDGQGPGLVVEPACVGPAAGAGGARGRRAARRGRRASSCGAGRTHPTRCRRPVCSSCSCTTSTWSPSPSRSASPTRAGVGRRDRPYLGVVLVDGVVAGSWGRTTGARGVVVRVTPLDAPLDVEGLRAAARRTAGSSACRRRCSSRAEAVSPDRLPAAPP